MRTTAWLAWLLVAVLAGCDDDVPAADQHAGAGGNRHATRDGGANDPERDAQPDPERDAQPDATLVPDAEPPRSDAAGQPPEPADAVADGCAENNGGCGDAASWACSTGAGGTAVCADVDECADGNGGCSERCVNRAGGYRCACGSRSELDRDGRTCHEWSKPQNIGDLTYGGEIALATNPAGHAVLVAYNRSTDALFATHYRPGGWGDQLVIDEQHPVDDHFVSPQVVLDDAGNALLISRGRHQAGGQEWPHAILAQRYDAAEDRWSASAALDAWSEAPLAGSVHWLHLQLDGAGNAFALWGGRGVSVSRWSAVDEAWSTPVVLDADATAGAAVLAVDPGGNALVAWLRGGVTWAARYALNTGWEAARSIDGGSAGNPLLAMDGAGNALAVWLAASNAELRVARFVAGTGWTAADALVQGTGAIARLELAVARDGRAHVLWQAQGVLRARSFEPGSGWEEPVEVSSSALRSGVSAQLAADELGNAYVSWTMYDGATNKNAIWANARDGGRWVGATLLASDGASTSEPSQLGAMAGMGVVVWAVEGGLAASRYLNGSWGAALPIDDVVPASLHQLLPPAWLDGHFTVVWAADQSTEIGGQPVDDISIYRVHHR